MESVMGSLSIRDPEFQRIPFKIVDAGRELRIGVTASSLVELIERARYKFEIDSNELIRIVLEGDGTEIDDDDYFLTLEPDTTLMILCGEDEKWTPYKSILTLGLALEPNCGSSDLNGCISTSTPASPVEELVWRLHQDLSFFPWLTTKELEIISKMDRTEMKKIVPDDKFLDFLQDLCERYLQDKEKEELHGSSSGSGGGSGSSDSGKDSITSILNDPIRLIRMYSKSNHFNTSNTGVEQNLRQTN